MAALPSWASPLVWYPYQPNIATNNPTEVRGLILFWAFNPHELSSKDFLVQLLICRRVYHERYTERKKAIFRVKPRTIAGRWNYDHELTTLRQIPNFEATIKTLSVTTKAYADYDGALYTMLFSLRLNLKNFIVTIIPSPAHTFYTGAITGNMFNLLRGHRFVECLELRVDPCGGKTSFVMVMERKMERCGDSPAGLGESWDIAWLPGVGFDAAVSIPLPFQLQTRDVMVKMRFIDDV